MPMYGMPVQRAYRFRFYPTPEQEGLLARTFGCARFVYNRLLEARTTAWRTEQRGISFAETSRLLTALKKEPAHIWLNDVSSVPLQQALRHLQTAFGNFFAKRAGYPTPKRKDGQQSVTYTNSAFRWDGRTLRLAKMAEPLAIRWSRTLPKATRITTVTVSKDAAGRYFVSMQCEDEVATKQKARGVVGIDLGLAHFAVLSTGEKIAAPNTFRRHESRLAILQRRLAKKQKRSANWAKARLKVARLHARIQDARKDFLHKLSTRLIDENQVIVVETLEVRNMQRSHHLAKSIGDAGWAEFVRQLEYKARWYGRTFQRIDRWYPSSKRCHDCGHVVSALPLNVREWTCPECGAAHDRDVNAARNILTAGLAGLACGETVSPVSL